MKKSSLASWLFVVFWSIFSTTGFAQNTCAQPVIVSDTKFAPGQIWTYRTRLGEEASTVTILRIEKTPKLGVIVHVRVDGITLRNCAIRPLPNHVEHMPFARAAIESSVTSMQGAVASVPDYGSGYHEWLSHCGGIYTITVADAVAVAEKTYKSGLKCS